MFGSITEAQARFRAEVLDSYASVERVLAAAWEAFDCGIATVTAVAEEVAFRDAVAIRRSARASGFRFIGPNTNGILSPGEARVGFFSEEFADSWKHRTHLSKWDALLRRPERAEEPGARGEHGGWDRWRPCAGHERDRSARAVRGGSSYLDGDLPWRDRLERGG